MNRLSLILLSILAAVAVIAGAAWYRYTHPIAARPPESRPATLAASAPASAPATVAAKPPTTQFLDLIRLKHPHYPATRACDEAVDLRYAGRFVLDEPVYLDQQGHLWITREDAPEKIDFPHASQSPSATHVVRERVVFVLWSANETGLWLPRLIVHNPDQGGYDLLDVDGRRHMEDRLGFRWDRALVLYGPRGGRDRIVVPTATGVCAFWFEQSPEEILRSHHALIDPAKAGKQAVQLTMDVGGVIAWATDASGRRGERGVARLAPATQPNPTMHKDYRWTNLTGSPGWPDRILHVIPLLDGSVLQIVSADEPDKVSFSLNTVENAAVDQVAVLRLIVQLSASDQAKRDNAFKQLTTYGPGIGPIIDKVIEDQPPEAQARLRQLLKNKVEPTLGGMSLVDSKMRVMSRLPDGGVLFYAEAGVSIPRPDEDPMYVTPAWIVIRPGRAVELLPEALVAELTFGKQTVTAWGTNYIVTHFVDGPQWFLGNRLTPLLRKSERRFSRFIGIDAEGRWIFREGIEAPEQPDAPTEKPRAAARAGEAAPETRPAVNRPPATGAFEKTAIQPQTRTTGPVTRQAPSSTESAPFSTQPAVVAPQTPILPTLILDPRLPDVTPRLPGWLLPPSAGKIGWSQRQWPVIFMEAQPKAAPWALEEFEWRAIDPSKEKVLTEAADVPAVPAFKPRPASTRSTRPAATQDATLAAATQATTLPATRQTTTVAAATQDAESALSEPGPCLMMDPDGTRYYDGQETLTSLSPDGQKRIWTLPNEAAGTGKVWLVRADDALFLFNTPGRAVRLAFTPDGPSPFELQSIFTRNIPNDADPLRIWVDPAGRICVAHDQNRITVLFPNGRIPAPIASKMPVEQLTQEE